MAKQMQRLAMEKRKPPKTVLAKRKIAKEKSQRSKDLRAKFHAHVKKEYRRIMVDDSPADGEEEDGLSESGKDSSGTPQDAVEEQSPNETESVVDNEIDDEMEEDHNSHNEDQMRESKPRSSTATNPYLDVLSTWHVIPATNHEMDYEEAISEARAQVEHSLAVTRAALATHRLHNPPCQVVSRTRRFDAAKKKYLEEIEAL